jgi:hypothetical protein
MNRSFRRFNQSSRFLDNGTINNTLSNTMSIAVSFASSNIGNRKQFQRGRFLHSTIFFLNAILFKLVIEDSKLVKDLTVKAETLVAAGEELKKNNGMWMVMLKISTGEWRSFLVL